MRMLLKGLLFALLSIVLIGCSNDSGSSKKDGDEVTWKLNHIRPPNTRTDDAAKKFSDDVEKATDGSVKINIYDSAQLGDYQIVQESVSSGEIEMQLASLSTQVDQTLQIAVVPNIVSNWEEAKELYNTETGFLTKYLAEQLDKQNIKLLAVFPQYFGSIFLAKEPNDPLNPESVKGLKVRVPGMKSFEKYAESIGFQVTPLPATDIFTSLQTGVIEGSIGGGTELYYNEYRDLGKYILPINTHFEAHYLTVNKDAFDSLSKENQESILSIAKDFETSAFELAVKEDTKYDELIEEEGIEVIKVTDSDLQNYADKIRAEVWPEIEKEYGDFFHELKTELGIE